MEKSLQEVVGHVPHQLGGNHLPLLGTSPVNGSSEKQSWSSRTEKQLRQLNHSVSSNESMGSVSEELPVTSARSHEHLSVASDCKLVSDIDSSPIHFNSPSHNQVDLKGGAHQRCSEGVTAQELMRNAGIGRGKHRGKVDAINNNESQKAVLNDLCNNFETYTTPASCPSEFLVSGRDKVNCNLVSSKEINLPYMGRTSDHMQTALREPRNLSYHAHTRAGQFSINESEAKNITANPMDRFKEHDFRKLHNGFDSVRSYKTKPFRMNRFANNGSSALQYKSFDNRTFAPRFPQSNMKGLRSIKPNDAYYRYQDIKKNHSSFGPTYGETERTMYGKSRTNACNEREIFENKNFPEITSVVSFSGISGSDSYVPHGTVTSFQGKSLCNKDERLNTCSKSWPNNNGASSNTSTVSCHSKSVVTSVKSAEPRLCGSCSFSDSRCCSFDRKNDCAFSRNESTSHGCESGENFAPVVSYRKDNNFDTSSCSPSSVYNNRSSSPKTSDFAKVEKLESNGQWQSSSDSLSDGQQSQQDVGHRHHGLRESSNSTCLSRGATPNLCESADSDSNNDKIYSSHQKNQSNAEELSSGNFGTDSVHGSPVLTSSNCATTPVIFVSQASYADVIRMPVSTVNKISVAHVFNSTSSSAPAVNNSSDAVLFEVIKGEPNQPNTSSEWIISRLSQINVNSSAASPPAINGVNPRPIAVSLEKPSFYNLTSAVGKAGVSAFAQQANLSSPERKVLESQFVDEQFCGMLVNSKSSEKLSFLSELPAMVGEQSNAMSCASAKTDSVFSDSSSVCSSTSSLFKNDFHSQNLSTKTAVPPVVIMNNCLPLESIPDISFGIDYDEIMEICSGSMTESVIDVSAMSASGSELCSNSTLNTPVSEKEMTLLEVESNKNLLKDVDQNYHGLNLLTIGQKKLVWKEEEVGTARCNLSHIIEFLQDAWNVIEKVAQIDAGDASAKVEYYSSE